MGVNLGYRTGPRRRPRSAEDDLHQRFAGRPAGTGAARQHDLQIGAAQWGWLAGIGLVHTGLVYALVYGAVPRLATPVIAVLTFLYPASAVAVDAAVYGRLVAPAQIAGIGLIVLAGLGVTLGRPAGRRAARPGPAPGT